MSRIAGNVTWLIGNTPLVALERLSPAGGARVVAKLELQNPTGSNKDRAALAMVEHAEQSGFLQPGGTIIEASAGDTAVALAMVAARRSHRLVLVMPANTPPGRRHLLRALGAEIVLTEPAAGIQAAFARAEQLAKEIAGALVLQPFTNRANARAHARGTAREIWQDTDGQVAIVVCPAGTGGTAAGCVAFFKEVQPAVQVVAVEPATSAVLSGEPPGPHNIPGLGPGFVPDILCVADLAEVVPVRETDAYAALRRLAREEGLLAGPASGAVLHAALGIAARPENRGRLLVAILPDQGERYAEHAAFAEDCR